MQGFEVGRQYNDAIDVELFDELDAVERAGKAGVAGPDHDFAVSLGHAHPVLNQIAVNGVVKQLHQSHRPADQHAGDAVSPLVVQMDR